MLGDDASRLVTWYDVFGEATAENALAVLEEEIRDYDRPPMSLDWENQGTPVQAYARKMPGEGGGGGLRALVKTGDRITKIYQCL